MDKKSVGPAYKDVAKKYKGQGDAVAKLTDKVKKGGQGVWGPVPMPPNAAVPDGDVKALVEGVNKAVAYMKAHPAESAKIIAKGVGGYLSKPEDVSEALKGVRFYDTAGCAGLMGQPGKPGPLKDVVSLANETWSMIQGKTFNVGYDDLVDTRFLKPAH